MPVGEGNRARAEETAGAASRFFASPPDRLAVQVFESCCICRRGPRRAFERRVERMRASDDRSFALERGTGGGKGFIHFGGNLGLEQFVEAPSSWGCSASSGN